MFQVLKDTLIVYMKNNFFVDIIENIWSEEQLLKDWDATLICLIYKKGNPQKCSHYRGIALLNTTYSLCILHIKQRSSHSRKHIRVG